jgi:hypothetical protein
VDTKGKKRDLEEIRNGAKQRYKGRKERNIKKGYRKRMDETERGIQKHVNEMQGGKRT